MKGELEKGRVRGDKETMNWEEKLRKTEKRMKEIGRLV